MKLTFYTTSLTAAQVIAARLLGYAAEPLNDDEERKRLRETGDVITESSKQGKASIHFTISGFWICEIELY